MLKVGTGCTFAGVPQWPQMFLISCCWLEQLWGTSSTHQCCPTETCNLKYTQVPEKDQEICCLQTIQLILELRVRCLAAAQSCQMFSYDLTCPLQDGWDGWEFFFLPSLPSSHNFHVKLDSVCCSRNQTDHSSFSSASLHWVQPPAAANHFYVHVAGSSSVHASVALCYSFSLRGCNS